MTEIKLLALDIDDTILDSSLKISQRNHDAISAAYNRGVKIVLCTGRSYLAAREVRRALDISDYMVCFGGAEVVATADGSVVHANYIDASDVKETLQAAFSLGLHAQIYQGCTVVFREENEFTKRYTGYLGLPFEVVPDILSREYNNVPKVLVFSLPEYEQQNIQKLRGLVPKNLHLLSSNPGFIEIGAEKATKGQALEWVADKWGIDRSEVAAIGDNTLDLDMIQWAGLGCCVANGNPLVKQQADMILPACKEDGVAYFIEKFILQ